MQLCNKTHLLTASQVHKIEFSTEFLLCFHMLLLDVDQEYTVAPRTMFIHVFKK